MAVVVQTERRPAARRMETRTWWLTGAGLPMLLLLLLPVLALVVKVPPGVLFERIGDPGTRQAVALSLSTSTLTAFLVVLFGTPLAYLLGRQRIRFGRLLEVFIDLPTVLPPAVAGLALLMAFGRRGLLGGLLGGAGIEVAFTPLAVVLAQGFVAAPYYIKSATMGLAGVSRELEQAAALDGARPIEIFRYIMLPLAWRGMIGGVALCWARALGEFGATIIFAGNYPGRTQTMPLAIYLGFEIDLNQALTLAAIMLAISFTILLGVRATLRQGVSVE